MTSNIGQPHKSSVTFGWRVPTWAVLLLIFAAGGVLRFYGLGTVPPGLYQDEAYNGLDALNVIGGSRPIYFSANNGREPFYIYLVAVSVAAFGRTPFAERLPAAMVGTLLIPATYLLGRALFWRRVGLFAAAGVAFTFWSLALSRIGLRAGSEPLFTALSLASTAWGWRLPKGHPHRTGFIALGGALYGFTFYTYLASRFTPVALFAFLILWYIAQRSNFPSLRQLVAFGLPAVAVALPLVVAARWQPDILLGRTGQVSILNPTINHGDLWGTLLRNGLAALGMFVWRGDTIARHNLPGRPVFDPVLGLAFLAGAWLVVRGAARRQLAPILALTWIGAMLLPTVLAEDTPHFLRAAGVLPVIFILPAVALDRVWALARPAEGNPGTGLSWRRMRWAVPVLVVAALGASLAWTVVDYFGRYAVSADTAYLFQTAAAELAQSSDAYLQGGPDRRLYLDQRYWDSFSSVRFLLPVQPGLSLFGEGEALTPAPGPLRLIAWPYENLRPALGALPPGALIHPQAGPLYRGDLEPAPYPLFNTYTADVDCPTVPCANPPRAEFGGRFQLLSATTRPVTGGLILELVWRAAHPDGAAHQVFAQAWAGGAIIAQADGPLGTMLFPSEWWRPGETVLEERRLAWTDPVNVANITIRVGLYDAATGVRLKRTDSTQDYVEIAP
jgi:hypothetical protein